MNCVVGRILVVDSDHAMRKHVAAELRRRGHRVAECAGRRAARTELGRRPKAFDLILLGLILDDGDGFELIHACRANPPAPLLLALSDKGNPSSDYLDCALACGADLALPKSEPLAELVAAAETLLGGDPAAVDKLKSRKKPQRTPLVWPARLIRGESRA